MNIISTLCNSHGLTRAQLAGHLRVTRQTLHRWERAATLPAYAHEEIARWQQDQPITALREALDTLPGAHRAPLTRALAHFVLRLAKHTETTSPIALANAIDQILS